jgi:NhaP-type Na+/H+ or K+/H+ antiporter
LLTNANRRLQKHRLIAKVFWSTAMSQHFNSFKKASQSIVTGTGGLVTLAVLGVGINNSLFNGKCTIPLATCILFAF